MITSNRKAHPERGSVLLVALILAAVIGVSLASYIKLANNSLKQASRSFYASSAINLAEIGLELALARFNELDVSPVNTVWAGWTLDSTTGPFTPSATRTFTGFTPGPGATGSVKVYVQHYAGSTATDTPRVVVQSTITQPDAPSINKYIEVKLKKREILGDGISSLDDITIVGGSFVGKSWNSNNGATPYTSGPITANLTVGSVNGDIDIGNGTIWGYAKVSDGNTIDPSGTVSSTDGVNDPDRRTDDFDGNFPFPDTPTGFTANNITSTIGAETFPRATDFVTVEGSKQIYYYVFSTAGKINIGGAATNVLQIEPNKNVVFIMNNRTITPATNYTIDVGGSASIQIGSGATLSIYTDGNVNIAGGGIVNANVSPASFMFWGTQNASGTPGVDIRGNGVLTGVFYAPGAALDIRGGGSGGVVTGAVVAKSVEFNGTTQFYYDESLAGLTFGNPYGASQWKELRTAAERAAYDTPLNF
jgi:hypothetical protein